MIKMYCFNESAQPTFLPKSHFVIKKQKSPSSEPYDDLDFSLFFGFQYI